MNELGNFLQMRNGVGINVFINLMDSMLEAVFNSSIFTTTFGVFIPVGISLCVVYFCVELMERATALSFSPDIFIRQMIRFLIAFILVSNIDSLIMGFNTFVNAINSQIINGLSGNITFGEYLRNNNDIIAMGKDYRTATGTAAVGANIIVAATFNVVIQFFIITIAVKRAITIGIKSILAPIIVPDIYHNGLNSGGIKFLKGLFADFFQTTVIIFVVEMASIVALQNGLSEYHSVALSSAQAISSGIICGFVIIGALRKSSQYANAIMSGSTD